MENSERTAFEWALPTVGVPTPERVADRAREMGRMTGSALIEVFGHSDLFEDPEVSEISAALRGPDRSENARLFREGFPESLFGIPAAVSATPDGGSAFDDAGVFLRFSAGFRVRTLDGFEALWRLAVPQNDPSLDWAFAENISSSDPPRLKAAGPDGTAETMDKRLFESQDAAEERFRFCERHVDGRVLREIRRLRRTGGLPRRLEWWAEVRIPEDED